MLCFVGIQRTADFAGMESRWKMEVDPCNTQCFSDVEGGAGCGVRSAVHRCLVSEKVFLFCLCGG